MNNIGNETQRWGIPKIIYVTQEQELWKISGRLCETPAIIFAKKLIATLMLKNENTSY